MSYSRRGGVRASRLAVLLGSVVAFGGCGLLPADGPTDAVRRAMQAVAAHDLPSASLLVCAARRDARTFPFTISGIFEPVGALPDFDIPRTLEIIDLDPSGLRYDEVGRAGGVADIEVTGVLVERFDPAEVEALFRDMAADLGQPVDDGLLAQTLENVAAGPVRLDVDQVVPVAQEAGAWRICEPAPVS